MVKIELMELTSGIVRYKYFPEDSKEYGIVMLDRKTGERHFEKVTEDYGMKYAAHALKRVEEYRKHDDYLQKDIVAWY